MATWNQVIPSQGKLAYLYTSVAHFRILTCAVLWLVDWRYLVLSTATNAWLR